MTLPLVPASRALKARILSAPSAALWAALGPGTNRPGLSFLYRHAPVDEIHLTSDNVDVTAAEKRVADQVPDMDKLGAHLKRQPAVIMTFGGHELECFTDEAHSQMHGGLLEKLVRFARVNPACPWRGFVLHR